MNNITSTINSAIDLFIVKTKENRIEWAHKPSAEKWSNKEIIGHLCDSAVINLQRFIRCTYEENFKLTYEQQEWVQVQRYQEMNMEDLLQFWKLLNGQIVRVLDNYPSGGRHAKCDNSKTGVTLHTVEFLAQDYLAHMIHHLNQIRLNEPVS